MTLRLPLLLGTTALCALPLLPVAAQQAQGGAEVHALPSVEVQARPNSGAAALAAPRATTGTKTDTPLIETPQSVSVITRNQMDMLQSQSVSEAMRYTPGVRTEAFGDNGRYDWFYIRGFSADTTGLFLDGLRFDAGALTARPEAWGLERLEILRGPSSVLFGQTSPGGVVNMVSRRPTQTPQGEIRLTAGTNDRYQAAFTTSGPLTQDGTWSYSLTGLLRDGETQTDFTPDNRIFIAPAITYRPTSDTRITLLSHYQYDEALGSEFLPYQGTAVASRFGRIPINRFTGEPGFDYFIRRQYAVGYEFEHRFNETFTVRQNLRYGHVDGDWRQYYGLGLQADGRTLNRYAYESHRESNTFGVDTQLQSRFATGPLQHTLLTGLDYGWATFDNLTRGANATPIDAYAPVYGRLLPSLPLIGDTLQTRNQLGLYAQDQIRYGNWVLTIGGRHDWATTESENRLTGSTTTIDDTAFTGRVGLTYVMPSGLAPYVSYSTSFLPQLGITASGAPFKPIEAEQYEAGVKFQPPGVNSFVQASVFQITQSNGLTPDPVNPAFQVQTGEVEVRGLEVEGVAEITPSFRVLAGFTYLEPEITRSNAGTRGNRPAGVPVHTASLFGDYTFREGALRGLGLGAGVRYVGNTPADDANTALVPSATVFDATARFELERIGLQNMRLNLTATNLEDKRYVASCSSMNACFYGSGRTVLATLSYAW